MKKQIITLALSGLSILSLLACGEPKSIEEYYETPENMAAVNEQVSAMLSQNADIYSDAKVSFVENTIIYEFILKEELPLDQKEAFDNYVEPQLQSAVTGVFAQVREESKVADDNVITIEYVYKNPNGSEYARYSYSE